MLAHLKRRHMPGHAQHRHQMPASRWPPRTKSFGVEVELCSMGAQPAHRRFAILRLRREEGMLAKPIVERRNRIALLQIRQRRWIERNAYFAAHLERAAVNPNDQRQRVLACGGTYKSSFCRSCPLVT